MTKFVLDSDTAAKLRTAAEFVELCDPDGRTVGYFNPAVDPDLYKTVEIPFTEAELDSFAKEPGGRSLKEILDDLKRKP